MGFRKRNTLNSIPGIGIPSVFFHCNQSYYEFQKIEGLVAAPFTPMYDDGSLKLDIIPQYTNYLQENGVKGIFICGSTGEGVSLTLDEKLKVMDAWAHTPFFKVMLVGGTSLEECKYLARQSVAKGFDAMAFIPPFYFKPANVSVLADCCAEVAAAAPNLPFITTIFPF